jgi:tetratricopeptide (TPR) repeat protein
MAKVECLVINNVFLRIAVLTFFCFSAQVWAAPEHVRSQAQAALSKLDAGQTAAAVKDLQKILRNHQDELSAEERGALLDILMQQTRNLGIEAYDRGDLKNCIKWQRAGMEFGPPTSEMISGQFEYPALFYVTAACLEADGRREEAAGYLRQARKLRKHVTEKDALATLTKFDKVLSQHVFPGLEYDVGAYVTNARGLQKWIGRVIKRRDNGVQVRITYCNSDRGFNGKPLCSFRKGKTYDFLVDEVKDLAHVSIDAVISGYR